MTLPVPCTRRRWSPPGPQLLRQSRSIFFVVCLSFALRRAGTVAGRKFPLRGQCRIHQSNHDVTRCLPDCKKRESEKKLTLASNPPTVA